MALRNILAGEERLQTLVTRLRGLEHWVTPRHLTALRLLLEGDHSAEEEVYRPLLAPSPATRLAAVDRPIGLLKRVGEIPQVQAHEWDSRYDGPPAARPHYLCTRCGAVADLVAPLRADAPGPVTDWRLGPFGPGAVYRQIAAQEAFGG